MKKDTVGKFATEHGRCFTPEYRSWSSMKKRCLNPGKDHSTYKGITICEAWVDSFAQFYKDMGPRPPKHTLDRIDNSKGYYPENCRWATPKQQNRNYSLNRMITYKGITLCITEWAEATGIHRHRIFQRLDRQKWSIEKALTTPVQKQFSHKKGI